MMESEEYKRDPDLFLKQILESEKEKRRRGKLKIFFGYAAGIGKTYAMLQSAHNAKESGIDVVAGYIEPHTRPETMALTQGLEMLAIKEVKYRNLVLKEFNLEAALERKPELILVDELAHTNAAGCRHEKRYQDIKELLQAGINVYTTVNVQHVESLNDSIAGITGITVRERIPDSVFDKAEQVELVDIEPEELLERMKEGRIYSESQANRAMYNFFTKDNLISLREIALRRMADRVNLAQDEMAHAKSETAEHILICLSPSPSNGTVIRQASRMTAAFHGRFTALYVETPEASDMPREDIRRLNENTRLAEQLGAKVVTSYGSDIVEEIAAYAKVARVTKIVLGRTYTKRRLLFIKDSFSEQLSRLAPSLEIFLIPDAYDRKYSSVRRRRQPDVQQKKIWTDAGICALSLLCSTAIAFLLNRFFGFSAANIVMVYMISVLMSAVFTSRQIWGIIASVMSILIFNFFFTEPYKTLQVNDPGYLITFCVMFITAVISSALTKKVKDYARQNAKKAYRTEILLETSRKLQDAGSLENIAERTAQQLNMLLERNVYFYLGKPGKNSRPVVCKAEEEADDTLDDSELAVAQWTYRNNKHAGYSTQTLPGARCLCMAVRSTDKVFAVVAIDMDHRDILAFEEGIMGAILNECAFALEKEELIIERKEADIKLQKEQLRANLLRSISHDLRTPLTSISGNAETLMGNDRQLDSLQRKAIYKDIYDDSIWLINLVENLLSVTRIENGSMKLNIQGEIVEDVITEALRHVNRRGRDQNIRVECEELLMARMDVKLMIQVIINLIDNAVKYTPPHSEIVIKAKRIGERAVVSVSDNGPGIVDSEKSKLFQMFYTSRNTVADGRRGMGLGLTLCQAVINAHGGEIKVFDNVPKGTIFRFELEVEDVIL
ncbi:sensor histidine kinase KdpD [Extibacter muris]|nr:sensor histidine kinase KdpD [Extibacter muris]MCB6200253.1 sensor histidine kinase KdpD [Extibacter muris]MCQ4663106.1 sensor histidine kinase KdpD [Extibacter muris]MCQ4692225.1 sensor histidine kinase KdpD [Extibacter muris]